MEGGRRIECLGQTLEGLTLGPGGEVVHATYDGVVRELRGWRGWPWNGFECGPRLQKHSGDITDCGYGPVDRLGLRLGLLELREHRALQFFVLLRDLGTQLRHLLLEPA